MQSPWCRSESSWPEDWRQVWPSPSTLPLPASCSPWKAATTFLTVPVVLRIFGCAMFASFFNDLGHNNFSSEIINHNLLAPTETAAAALGLLASLRFCPSRCSESWEDVAGSGCDVDEHPDDSLAPRAAWRAKSMAATSGKQLAGGRRVQLRHLHHLVRASLRVRLSRCTPRQCVQSIQGGADRCPAAAVRRAAPTARSAHSCTRPLTTSARLLFDRSLSYAADYHVAPLIVYGLAYWVLVSLIYGAYVPGTAHAQQQQQQQQQRPLCRSHSASAGSTLTLCPAAAPLLRRPVRPVHRRRRRVWSSGRHRRRVSVPQLASSTQACTRCWARPPCSEASRGSRCPSCSCSSS